MDLFASPSKNSSSPLTEFSHWASSASREIWYRRMVRLQKHTRTQGFFDAHPRFFSTSDTESAPDRLNQRHCALVQSNAAIIEGRRVLDIASHDGRWSFAANQAGAKYVLGIEARQHLVEAARGNIRAANLPAGAVEFIRGDLFTELDRLEPETFDTVFCFWFLYHTI